MSGIIAGWFAGGGRIRSVIGNSFILKEGKPWICLGTPGNCRVVVPQVLSNILDYGMEPYEAAVAPRMDWLLDDYTVEVESRLSAATVAGLARMGILVKPLPPFCTVMGSFQMCWRPGAGSRLAACSDPRREGSAGGF
jgi:gamma-glutamyltranspeptidase/glutathione hydrolase